MDFKSMKRKQLQALCKKRGLPANSTNAQMAQSLTSLLTNEELFEQEQEKIKPRGCLKGSGGSNGEGGEGDQVVSKKVSFSLQEEKLEFEGFQNGPHKNRLPERNRSSRRRSIIEVESEKFSEEMVEEKASYESPKRGIDVPFRTTRSCGVAVAVVWSPIIEKKKVRKGTEGIQGNDELQPVVDFDSEDQGDTRKSEKEASAVEPTTRSLRHRVVTVGGNDGVAVHPNPRRTWRKKDVSENDDVVVDADDATKMTETSCKEPVVRSLRSRVVVAEGNEGAERNAKPRRTKRKKDCGKNEEDALVAPISEGTLELRQDEALAKEDLGKRRRGVAASSGVSVSKQIENALLHKDPFPRHSKRNLQNFKASASEDDKTVIEEEDEVSKSKDLRKGVDGSQVAAGVDKQGEHALVCMKKSEAQGRNRITRREARAVSVLDIEALTKMIAVDTQEEPPKLFEVEGALRRSSRNFSKQNVLDHAPNIPAAENLRDDNFVSTNCTVRKQDKKSHPRNGSMPSPAPITETEAASCALGFQEKLQSAIQIEEAPRRSRHNASKSNATDNVIPIPAIGKLQHIDKRVRGNRSRKHQRNTAPEKQSVEALDVHQQLPEPSRRSTRHASRSGSLAVPALKAVSEEIVGRRKPNKRTREADFDRDITAVEREVVDRSHPSKGRKKSQANRHTETSKRVQVDDEFLLENWSPHPSPSLFEDLHEDVKDKYHMQKQWEKKEFSQMQTSSGSGQETADRNRDMEDTVLKSEDNGEKATYVCHIGGLETGVGIDIESNASELMQPLLVDNTVSGHSNVEQLQKVGDDISLDGTQSSCLEDRINFGSGTKAKHCTSTEVTHDVQAACLSEFIESSNLSTEKVFIEVPFWRAEALVDAEQSVEGASEDQLSMDDIGSLPSQVDPDKTCMQANIQENKVEIKDPKSNKPAVMPDYCCNLLNTLSSEDDYEGNVLSNLSLSCNDVEKLSPVTVTKSTSNIHSEEPAMLAEIKDASNGSSSVHSSNNDDQTVVLLAKMNESDSRDLSDLQNASISESETLGVTPEIILSSQSAHGEPNLTKITDSVVVDNDLQSCKAFPIEVKESSLHAGLSSVSRNIGSRAGVVTIDGDEMEADARESLLCADNHGLPKEGLSRGDGLSVVGASCHRNMEPSDPLYLPIEGGELSFLKDLEITCKTKGTSTGLLDFSDVEGNMEWIGNSRSYLDRRLDEVNENTVSLQENSFKSEELEEGLEVGRKEKEFLRSKSRKLSCEIMGDISKRTECSIVSKVKHTMEAALEGELHVNNKDSTVLQLIFDSGFRKQSITHEVVPQVVDTGSTMQIVTADTNETSVNVLQYKGGSKPCEVANSTDVPLPSTHGEESPSIRSEVQQESDFEESFKQADIHDNGQMTSDINNCSSVSPDNDPNTDVADSSTVKNDSRTIMGLETVLASEECAVSKHEDLEEDSDPQSSPEKLDERVISSFSLSNTENVCADALRGDSLDEKNIDEFKYSLAHDSPRFDQFSGDQVQEHGDEVSYKEIMPSCLGNMASGLSNNKEHSNLEEKKISYVNNEYLIQPPAQCNKFMEQAKILGHCNQKVYADETCADLTAALCMDVHKENRNSDNVVKGITDAEKLSGFSNTEATLPVDNEKPAFLFKTPSVKIMLTATDACSSVLKAGSLGDYEAGGPAPEEGDAKNHIPANVVVSVGQSSLQSVSQEFKAIDISQESLTDICIFQTSHSLANQSFSEGSNLQWFKGDLEEIKETYTHVSGDKVDEVPTDGSALGHNVMCGTIPVGASYIVGMDSTRKLDGLPETASGVSEDLDDELGRYSELKDKVAYEMKNMEASKCEKESAGSNKRDASLFDGEHLEKGMADSILAEDVTISLFSPAKLQEDHGTTLANILYKCHAEIAEDNISSEVLVSQSDWSVSEGGIMSEEKKVTDKTLMSLGCDVSQEVYELDFTVSEEKETAETVYAEHDKPLLSSVNNEPTVPPDSASTTIIPAGGFDRQGFGIEEEASYESTSPKEKHEEAETSPKDDSMTTPRETSNEELDYANCQDDSRREETVAYNTLVITETTVSKADYNEDNCGKSFIFEMEQDAVALVENETKHASHAARQSQFYLQEFCLNTKEKADKDAMDHITSAKDDCLDSASFEGKQYDCNSCKTPKAKKGLNILLGHLSCMDHQNSCRTGSDASAAKLEFQHHEVAGLGENRDSADVSENTSSPEAPKQHEINEDTRSEERRSNVAEGRCEQTALNDGDTVEGAAFLSTSSDQGMNCKSVKSIHEANAGDEYNSALTPKTLQLDEGDLKIDDNNDIFDKAPDDPTSGDIDSDFDSPTPDKSVIFQMDSQVGMCSNGSVQTGSEKCELQENSEPTESEGLVGIASTNKAEVTTEENQVENIELISDVMDHEKVEEEDNIHAKREAAAYLESENLSAVKIRSDSAYDKAVEGLELQGVLDFDPYSRQTKSCQDVNSIETSKDGNSGEVYPSSLVVVPGNQILSVDGFESLVEQGNLIDETMLGAKIPMNEKVCNSENLESTNRREFESEENGDERIPSCTVHGTVTVDQVASIARAVVDMDEPKSDDNAEASNDGNLAVPECQSCNTGDGSQHNVVSTLAMPADNSLKSELGVYHTSELEKSDRTQRLEQMEEISGRLTNFRISSARKTSRIGFQKTPMKLVTSVKHQALIDGTKDKENTPIVKTGQHNMEKSAMACSARRPLRSVDNNNKSLEQ